MVHARGCGVTSFGTVRKPKTASGTVIGRTGLTTTQPLDQRGVTTVDGLWAEAAGISRPLAGGTQERTRVPFQGVLGV